MLKRKNRKTKYIKDIEKKLEKIEKANHKHLKPIQITAVVLDNASYMKWYEENSHVRPPKPLDIRNTEVVVYGCRPGSTLTIGQITILSFVPEDATILANMVKAAVVGWYEGSGKLGANSYVLSPKVVSHIHNIETPKTMDIFNG